jgi:ferric-dicitrate binding protein FerR (iron transport regulator)
MLGIGVAGLYLSERSVFSKKITVATDINQKNLEVTLPDGSVVILNRETVLSYRSDYGKNERIVSLSGEAFFEITPDQDKPFTIDAGKAKVKVLGTSFNVITDNPDAAVEVFVKTGKVMLSDNSGSNTLLLEPGYVGTIDSEKSDRSFNENPNYMAWNTGVLVYDGQTLDIVFRDLKRVYNMDIIADDPSILQETWTSPSITRPRKQ